MQLSDYDIDTFSGFLPAVPPLSHLPQAFEPWERLVPRLSGLIRSRKIRAALQALPCIAVRELTSIEERERAFLLLCVFTNAWVWGGDEPHLCLPAQIALPVCALADILGRPPITHYASMALRNWTLLDETQPLSPDNARMQIQFLGGVDEDWFFVSSLGVELAGAPLLPLVVRGLDLSSIAADGELTRVLEEAAAVMAAVCEALARVREWCDPSAYYLRVRPFLSGWPDPGLLYEGVSREPCKYIGGSAGQSSLIQALDAFLGVNHDERSGGRYLRLIRAYMPVAHRKFVEDVERLSPVRGRAQGGSATLRAAYNAVVGELERFRRMHALLARDFITLPANGGAPGETGTGGTALASFLHDACAATSRCRL